MCLSLYSNDLTKILGSVAWHNKLTRWIMAMLYANQQQSYVAMETLDGMIVQTLLLSPQAGVIDLPR